jgi:hypothetical protein
VAYRNHDGERVFRAARYKTTCGVCRMRIDLDDTIQQVYDIVRTPGHAELTWIHLSCKFTKDPWTEKDKFDDLENPCYFLPPHGWLQPTIPSRPNSVATMHTSPRAPAQWATGFNPPNSEMSAMSSLASPTHFSNIHQQHQNQTNEVSNKVHIYSSFIDLRLASSLTTSSCILDKFP